MRAHRLRNRKETIRLTSIFLRTRRGEESVIRQLHPGREGREEARPPEQGKGRNSKGEMRRSLHPLKETGGKVVF